MLIDTSKTIANAYKKHMTYFRASLVSLDIAYDHHESALTDKYGITYMPIRQINRNL